MRRNQRDKQKPPAAPKASPVIAPTTPRGNPKTADPAMINGLAGRKNSDPIARNRARSKTPSRPRLPTQVQRFWRAGMTGKKYEAIPSPVRSTIATASFLVNEDTTYLRKLPRFIERSTKGTDVLDRPSSI